MCGQPVPSPCQIGESRTFQNHNLVKTPGTGTNTCGDAPYIATSERSESSTKCEVGVGEPKSKAVASGLCSVQREQEGDTTPVSTKVEVNVNVNVNLFQEPSLD